MPAFQGLHKALRWLRLESNRKQREVAEAAGITQAMLCSYEQGKRQPSLASLEKILDSLGTDLGQLKEVLALVNGDIDGGGRPLAGDDAYPSLAFDPLPASIAEPAIGIERVLGIDGRLSAEQEVAFRQMLDGFYRWLRLLHRAAPPPRPEKPTARKGS